MSKPDLTVFYDGACPLCRAEINHYSQQEGAQSICFLDVSQVHEDALPAGVTRDQALARFHVQTSDGHIITGAQGFVEIWKILPHWRWAAWLALRPGGILLLERAYRGFLPLRPILSKFYAGLLRLKSK